MRKRLMLLLMVLMMVLVACGNAVSPETEDAAGTAVSEAGEAADAAADAAAEAADDAEAAVDEAMDDAEEAMDDAEEAVDDAMSGDAMANCEADELGCVTVAPGEAVNIAYALVISGPNEPLGRDSANGVEMAVEAFGELDGHPINIIVGDDGCSPEGGQTVAQRLTADESIVGIIGTSCSSAANTAIPLVTQAGMVMISPSNTAPALTAEDRGDEYAGYLRTAHNDLFQGRVAADFAYNELGARTAATIHDGSIYADSLQQVFADRFAELGGEVVAQEAVNVGDTDMRSVLTNIASNAPEVLYYPVFTAEAGFITSQAKEVSGLEDTILMSADGAFSPDFIKAAGDAAVGMYQSGPYVASADYDAFIEAHVEKYGTVPPSGFHAHAYDATMILLNAVKEVAGMGEDGTLYIPRTALRDAVYATKDYAGLTGTLSCDQNGDCATGEALAIFELTEDVVSDPDNNFPPAAIYQPGTGE
ncbi:MAG: branched-chain amino acid ABC transporter substrate-binding protein [Anaerolineales bacterium]|nr:branched-chain amino acid ABC transporter substrate-binding protein [Anaerolineales bacterium]MCB9127838.1 branched-chain amino acid ABC transporter substrate-binding protein [Ardenticatenales bacterium]MCB9172905.1 branched-chain amino acid ABC transporter substrate-binding protein [Ardenticatenales bacterium]